MASVTDSATGVTTKYYYDFTSRLLAYEEAGNGHSLRVGYSYDIHNNLTGLTQTVNGVERISSYTYDDDNRVTSVTADGVTVEYTYDALGRVSQQVTKQGETTVLTESFTYTTVNGNTSAQIATYTTVTAAGTTTYSYTYDGNGNILSVSDGTNTTSYVYDKQNQLIRENNQAGGFTHTWAYDDAGNIQTRTEYAYTTAESLENVTPTDTVTYTYGDASWKDLLTAYDGTAVTYDGIGNPNALDGWSFTWEHGRELATMSDGTTTWTNTYNADGLRTKRTNGTTTYSYVYTGSSLLSMSVGNDTLYFNYDAAGIPLTVTYNGTTYYYATNLQGDIVGILDSTGTTVVSYTYDAWGNPTGTTGSLATTLGQHNPLRYRGYVYDIETSLYYLQTRYYNPRVCRFLNADGYTGTGQGFTGNNTVVYCSNNPVANSDHTGMLDERTAGGGPGGGYVGSGYYGSNGVPGGQLGQYFQPVTYGTTTIPAEVFIIPFIVPGTNVSEAMYTELSVLKYERKTQEQAQVLVDTQVLTQAKNTATYVGADMYGGTWKLVTSPMTYDQAKVWVFVNALIGTYGKKASWGLYTSNAADACAMAWDLGFAVPPIAHYGKPGEHPHFHVNGFDLFNVYKHFHVWYGREGG